MSIKTIYWDGGKTGSWSTASDWTGRIVPTAGTIALDQTGVITASNVTISGTVWLDYAANGPNGIRPVGLDLFGSIMGPNSYLLSEALAGPVNIELHNTILEGEIATAAGPTIMIIMPGSATLDDRAAAANFGRIDIQGSTITQSSSVTLVATNGAFSNEGIIQAAQYGRFSLVFGNSQTGTQLIGNAGAIRATVGGDVSLSAEVSGEIGNSGTISAAGGDVYLNTQVEQYDGGTMTISNSGYMKVGEAVTGGTIQIQSGMLDFGVQLGGPGPIAASQFHAAVDFTGSSGEIAFGNSQIQEAFNAARNDVAITVPWEGTRVQIADIQLGTAREYSAAMFSTFGPDLMFHAPS